MATSSVEQRGQNTDEVGRALLVERFGEVRPLAAERFTGRRRGLGALLCTQCHIEHDQAVAAGRWPQPVHRAVPGSDCCPRHRNGGSDGR
jgi:hypothetical protein